MSNVPFSSFIWFETPSAIHVLSPFLKPFKLSHTNAFDESDSSSRGSWSNYQLFSVVMCEPFPTPRESIIDFPAVHSSHLRLVLSVMVCLHPKLRSMPGSPSIWSALSMRPRLFILSLMLSTPMVSSFQLLLPSLGRRGRIEAPQLTPARTLIAFTAFMAFHLWPFYILPLLPTAFSRLIDSVCHCDYCLDCGVPLTPSVIVTTLTVFVETATRFFCPSAVEINPYL